MAKFRSWLQRFMIGRRGPDELSRFLLITALVCMLISSLARGIAGALFDVLGFAAVVWCIIRFLSRNQYKRHQENIWYLQRRGSVVRWFRSLKDRWQQRREYSFFRCPECHALLRVPKNKGKLLLTCRKCGNRFERKT